MESLLKYRVLLIINSLALIAFGLAFLIAPYSMTANLGITIKGTDAVADVCAVYGGFELAIGLFLAFCSRSKAGIHFGLIAATMTLIGFLTGRVVGILSEGHPTGATYQLLSIDLFGALLDTGFLIYYFKRDRN